MANKTDIVVLTVIPPELDAAKHALHIESSDRRKDQDGTVWYCGTIISALTRRPYSVLLTCTGMAGTAKAAAAAREAIDGPKPQKYTLTQKPILSSLGLGEDEGWEFHGDDRRPTRPSTWQEFCQRSYEARRKREAEADAEFLKECGIRL
jgi:hypothetical protein